MSKVVLGLSGGVDSALAAQLLKNAGHEVYGVFLDIGITPAEEARSVAEQLGIAFEAVDIRDELEAKVCKPFAEAYLGGRTPNPCVMCNPTVKFPALIRAADRIGAEYIATGHYARVERDEDSGRYRLVRADSSKDQSYMLCGLSQDILSRVIFPLGDLEKETVRQMAEEAGISVAHKSDSMEICFIPDNDHGKYIQSRGYESREGNFVDEEGNVLGCHKGIVHYTVGQRRGLGVAAGRRIFVSRIDPAKNEIVLSDLDKMQVRDIRIKDVNWVSMAPAAEPFRAEVKVRYSKISYAAQLVPEESGLHIIFDEEIKAPSAGQAAVFYNGDVLLGGGTIV